MTETFTIPDSQSGRLTAVQMLDRFCDYHQYDTRKIGAETKRQFWHRVTIDWWMFAVNARERQIQEASVTPIVPPDVT